MSYDKFRELVLNHDLTYSYSDDHSKWRAGEAQLKEIRELAGTLDMVECRKIWNEIANQKIAYQPEDFYWK